MRRHTLAALLLVMATAGCAVVRHPMLGPEAAAERMSAPTVVAAQVSQSPEGYVLIATVEIDFSAVPEWLVRLFRALIGSRE